MIAGKIMLYNSGIEGWRIANHRPEMQAIFPGGECRERSR
jgi:hypothetical protein